MASKSVPITEIIPKPENAGDVNQRTSNSVSDFLRILARNPAPNTKTTNLSAFGEEKKFNLEDFFKEKLASHIKNPKWLKFWVANALTLVADMPTYSGALIGLAYEFSIFKTIPTAQHIAISLIVLAHAPYAYPIVYFGFMGYNYLLLDVFHKIYKRSKKHLQRIVEPVAKPFIEFVAKPVNNLGHEIFKKNPIDGMKELVGRHLSRIAAKIESNEAKPISEYLRHN